MASTSRNSSTARISTAANGLLSDNQTLISDIRKAISMFKGIAVDLEKHEKHHRVNQLEDGVLELLEAYDDCTRFSDAIQAIGNSYQPSDQPTDFKKLLVKEANKLKAASTTNVQNNPLYRSFKEAVWDVHHAGQPMPGEEEEDIIMTTTQNFLLNITCPITGKPIIELEDPVRCMDCKHIYEKNPIFHYIKTKKPKPECPVAGCPRILHASRVGCDPELLIEIEEMRAAADNGQVQATAVEDCTEIDDV